MVGFKCMKNTLIYDSRGHAPLAGRKKEVTVASNPEQNLQRVPIEDVLSQYLRVINVGQRPSEPIKHFVTAELFLYQGRDRDVVFQTCTCTPLWC
jgi:hypothetical protein